MKQVTFKVNCPLFIVNFEYSYPAFIYIYPVYC